VPRPKSAARAELRARVKELVLVENKTYREVCGILNIGSTATISRLLHEDKKHEMTQEIQDQELARMDAWAERLEESYEKALFEGDLVVVAALAKSAAQISRERRMIRAVDIAPTLKLQHSHADKEFVPDTFMAKAIDDYKQTKLFAEGLKATNGDEQ